MLSKSDIRQEMLSKRKILDSVAVAQSGRELLLRLCGDEDFVAAQSVFIYISAKNEVSTRETIEFLLKNTIKVCVPKLFGKVMRAVWIDSQEVCGAAAKVNAFGICEPLSSDFAVDIDVAVVPGVAFDRKGNRIGFGAGYYDKYFSRNKEMLKIGVCYDFQLTDELPAEETDVLMDRVICV